MRLERDFRLLPSFVGWQLPGCDVGELCALNVLKFCYTLIA